jgi:hypothetical protein
MKRVQFYGWLWEIAIYQEFLARFLKLSILLPEYRQALTYFSPI